MEKKHGESKNKQLGICTFSDLPVNVVSKIFVLSQNPRAALITRGMHYGSHQSSTIRDFILRYTRINRELYFYTNLDKIYEKYPFLRLNEEAGVLLLRKIKKIRYERVLELAIRNRWKNIVKKLMRMYIVVSTVSGDVIYANTAFMHDGEILDIDIDRLNTQTDEARGNSDIFITDTISVRPLIALRSVSMFVSQQLYSCNNKMVVEEIVELCEKPIKLPESLFGNIDSEISLLFSKNIVVFLIIAPKMVCVEGDLELLKRLMKLKVYVELDYKNFQIFRRSPSFSDRYDYYKFERVVRSEDRATEIIYSSCVYYSIKYEKKHVLDYILQCDMGPRYKQIAFDVSIAMRRWKYVKKTLATVELDRANIRKLTHMAYSNHNTSIIRYLVNREKCLMRELNDYALMAAIQDYDFKLASKIMKKYPTSATELSLKEAIGSGNVGLVKKFVKLGMDITKCSFDAIELACIRVCLEMVRFLIKSGVKTDEDRPVVSGLLNRAEQIVLEYLVFGKFDFDINGPRNTIEGSASEKNRYSRVLECLCEYGLGFSKREYNRLVDNINDGNIGRIKSDVIGVNYSINEFRNPTKCLVYAQRVIRISGFMIKNNYKLNKFNSRNERRFNTRNIFELREKFRMEKNAMKGHCLRACVINDENFIEMVSRVENAKLEILNLLFDSTMCKPSENELLLRKLYYNGDIKWINHFTSKGVKPQYKSSKLVQRVSESGNVEALKNLFSQGWEIDPKSISDALPTACELGSLEMVRVLVEKGADMNHRYSQSIGEAYRSNSPEIVRYLFEKGCSTGRNKYKVLKTACMFRDTEMVKLLISSGIDLSNKRCNGIIYLACSTNNLELVKLLVQAGANPEDELTECIKLARKYNDHEFVDVLAKCCENTKFKDEEQFSGVFGRNDSENEMHFNLSDYF